MAIPVCEGHRHSIELQLAYVINLLLACKVADPTVPIAQLIFVIGVIQREHRAGMLYLCKALFRLASYALGGRVRCYQLRMRSLKLLELDHEQIELWIADLRIVKHVVAVLVVTDSFPQLFYPFNRLASAHFVTWAHV